ncbi:MAG: fused MFS/spermidine synthase, partial [Myxococcales bacterium]|nr:fused MFS/spermidine synthase [Myxococcales bacterium]
TLPAAAKAVTRADDEGRGGVAVLYGVNTLGAVVGAFLASFFLLEALGTRLTLWSACALNAAVGSIARRAALTPDVAAAAVSAPPVAAPKKKRKKPVAAPLTALARARAMLPWAAPSAAAFVAGFVFFLLELVWYRVLGPLLGGSSYTFGLILSVALAGIGLGSAFYARFLGGRAATLRAFGATCALEATCVLVPFALGDRVAVLALWLRPLAASSFGASVVAWTVVTVLVVFPASFVAGLQFPLLIGLFGRGDAAVARHVGVAYVANTIGAILGSLAGGFGFLPAFGALGCWRLVGWALAITGGVAVAATLRDAASRRRSLPAAGLLLAAVALARADGPTNAWRVAGIGAGREDRVLPDISQRSIRAWQNERRATVAWSVDGLESHVALSDVNAYAFVVNGKSDGNAIDDAPTQILSGLIGAALHERPERALVIGLGTGSTAGWLGRVPSMQRVDVVELEPAILRVARDCAPINESVLDNPRVHVSLGDAREVLLTTSETYDLVVSEPSNPYRAGVSSMFTAEYYEAARARLRPRGLFVQWVQAYETDGATIRTALSTMRTAFGHVTVWRTMPGDLLFVAGNEPLVIDAKALGAKLDADPYRFAMARIWRSRGVEGFLAHFLADRGLADRARELSPRISTDDKNLLEFAFARTVGRGAPLGDFDVGRNAERAGAGRPPVEGPVDAMRVEQSRLFMLFDANEAIAVPSDPTLVAYRESLLAYRDGDMKGLARAWSRLDRDPADAIELEMVADFLGRMGDPRAEESRAILKLVDPVGAEILRARALQARDKKKDAIEAYAAAFELARTSPWGRPKLLRSALSEILRIAADDDDRRRLVAALERPFAVGLEELRRRSARVRLLARMQDTSACVGVFEQLEPWPPWEHSVLAQRAACYRARGHRLAAPAEADLAEWAAQGGEPFAPGDVFSAESDPDAARK